MSNQTVNSNTDNLITSLIINIQDINKEISKYGFKLKKEIINIFTSIEAYKKFIDEWCEAENEKNELLKKEKDPKSKEKLIHTANLKQGDAFKKAIQPDCITYEQFMKSTILELFEKVHDLCYTQLHQVLLQVMFPGQDLSNIKNDLELAELYTLFSDCLKKKTTQHAYEVKKSFKFINTERVQQEMIPGDKVVKSSEHDVFGKTYNKFVEQHTIICEEEAYNDSPIIVDGEETTIGDLINKEILSPSVLVETHGQGFFIPEEFYSGILELYNAGCFFTMKSWQNHSFPQFMANKDKYNNPLNHKLQVRLNEAYMVDGKTVFNTFDDINPQITHEEQEAMGALINMFNQTKTVLPAFKRQKSI